MKKAGSFMEYVLLFAMVVLVAVAAMTFYNNLKLKLTKMSQVKLKSQVVEVVSKLPV